MSRRLTTAAAMAALLPLALACQSDGDEASAEAGASASATTTSAGVQTSAAASASAAPTMIRVSLQNVATDLAAQLMVERTAIPADVQAPLALAVSACGVSAKILSTPTGEQAACAAKTASAELGQLVQQQLAAGGSASAGANAAAGTTPPASTPN